MNQQEMEISNFNYDAATFLARIKDLLDRDRELLGQVVQRTVLVRTPAGELQHGITRIDVLPAQSPAGSSEILDYKKLKYVREILSKDVLIVRLGALLAKGFEVTGHQFVSTGLGFYDRYEPSRNIYSEWPSRVFDVTFNNVQLSYEPILHPDLKSFSSASEAISELLNLPGFGLPDGRLGHILVCIPNLNARIAKLEFANNLLGISVDGASKAELLKLDLNYKSESDSGSLGKRLEQKSTNFKLPATPNQLRLWLISVNGFLADFHEEDNRFSTGANAVLPKLKQPNFSGELPDTPDPAETLLAEPSRIFIVHGHNVPIKEGVAEFLKDLRLVPVILHEQPNEGRTIIEKFEFHSAVGFAVVLLTDDDEGRRKGDSQTLKGRARQNVVFELGYFTAKLGRRGVVCILEDGVEIPSDFQGVVYIRFDPEGIWKFQLVRELKAAGFDVDANQAL